MTILSCGHTATPEGKALRSALLNGQTICQECATANELERMHKTGQATLYYGYTRITNWPGTIVIQATDVKRTRTRPFGHAEVTRTDVWFSFGGYLWHGYNASDNNTLLHCKRGARPIRDPRRYADEYPDPLRSAEQLRAHAEKRTRKQIDEEVQV